MKKFSKKGIVIASTSSIILGVAGLVFAATTISLGTADSFAILAGSGITNTNATTVNGDIGTYPTLTENGFGTITLTGTNHIGDATTQSAKTALVTAYGAASQPVTGLISADLGGQTLAPGVYKDNGAPASLGITGTLTLDGQGYVDSVFIFQSASTLTTAAASHVTLINGAQACNVFWQVGTSATLGTTSDFKGTIIAMDSITDNGGSTIEGRLLARNAAVTLNNTTVTVPGCVVRSSIPRSTAQAAVVSVPPLINVTKIPTPLTHFVGGGNVTYNYAVTNIGIIPMFNVTILDNKCSKINFISGDSNNNTHLDVGEIWNYQCSKIVTKTETNTVTVHGVSTDNSFDAYDVASATVVVSGTKVVVPPLIHLVKTPNVFTLPAQGGAVTYSYKVTNPGTEPLHDVSITDDKCTGLPGRVVGHPGDTNKNNLLESNETWSFTCQTNITQTTTNTGIAEGHANGLTAIDISLATVAVAAPGLPNTGLREQGMSWVAIASGLAVVILGSLYYFRRKQTV